jgi:hypothetical protein
MVVGGAPPRGLRHDTSALVNTVVGEK